MSFRSRLEDDFRREYQNVEFLFRQRPGLGGMAALPPSVSQVPGQYFCFMVTRVSERNTIEGVSTLSLNPPSIASAKLKSGSSSHMCDHLAHFRDTLESTIERKWP